MAEIGDKSKLRRISDILLARSAKMLPSAVNTDEWQPVLSYGIDVDDQSFFITQETFSIAALATITRGVGASEVPASIVLPGGFLYQIQYMNVATVYGAAPLNDEKLRIELDQNFYDVPAAGGIISVSIVDMAPEDQQPYIRTRAAQSSYVFTYPSSVLGTVLPSGLEQLASRNGPPIIIPVPESASAPGRSVLEISIRYNDAAGNPKNFPAGSTGTIVCFFKRIPVSNFNMAGI